MKILHTADVHLGAPFKSLGDRGHEQRMQLRTTLGRVAQLAIDERVDAMVIAGDLFDGDRPVSSLVAAARQTLRPLIDASIPLVILPGTHDFAAGSSLWRDIGEWATVLNHDRPTLSLPAHGATIHALIGPTRTMAGSPFASMSRDDAPIQIGIGHGSLHIPNLVEEDDTLFRDADIAASGLNYLALGHWHGFQTRRVRETKVCYPGSPELIATDQIGSGFVALATLAAGKPAQVDQRKVGRRRFARHDIAVDGFDSTTALLKAIETHADPDLVCEIRLTGHWADTLLASETEIQRELGGRFFHLRVRDAARPRQADIDPTTFSEATVIGRTARSLAERAAAASTDDERRTVDEALRLAVGVLRGEDVGA